MTIITETYFGEPLTFRLITPGDTVTYFDNTSVLNRREHTTYIERKLSYTSGGTYVMKAGDKIVGATGGATAIIVSRTITSGTDGAPSDAAGVLTLKCQTGTFQSENLNVEANANCATIAADSTIYTGDYPNKGRSCKAVLVHVVTNTILINSGSVLPGQTSLYGISLGAGNSVVLHDPNEIRNLCCVDAVSGSAGSVRMIGYF